MEKFEVAIVPAYEEFWDQGPSKNKKMRAAKETGLADSSHERYVNLIIEMRA